MKKTKAKKIKKMMEDKDYYICPNCNSLTSEFAPYFKNVFEPIYGYFVSCENCHKTSYLQIVRGNQG